jgi:hypothetical protein
MISHIPKTVSMTAPGVMLGRGTRPPAEKFRSESRNRELSLFGFTPYLPPCIRTGGEITQRLQISPWP